MYDVIPKEGGGPGLKPHRREREEKTPNVSVGRTINFCRVQSAQRRSTSGCALTDGVAQSLPLSSQEHCPQSFVPMSQRPRWDLSEGGGGHGGQGRDQSENVSTACGQRHLPFVPRKDSFPLSTDMVVLFEPLTMLTTCDVRKTAFGSPRYRIQKRSLEQLTNSQDTRTMPIQIPAEDRKNGVRTSLIPLGFFSS